MEVKTISTEEENKLARRADCMSRVHKYINEVVPKLVAQLETGFKLTNGSRLYQKDADIMREIKDTAVQPALSQGTEGRKGSGAYVVSDEYNIKLEVSDNYPDKYHSGSDGGHSCEYYKKTIYLWNNQDKCPAPAVTPWEPLEHVNRIDMINAANELIVAEKEMSELKDKISKLKRQAGK